MFQSRSLFAGATGDADPQEVPEVITWSSWAQNFPVSVQRRWIWALVICWLFYFFAELGFSCPQFGVFSSTRTSPTYSQKQPFSSGKATLPTQEPANCLLLSGLSFYNSFTLFRVIRPQEMQLGPWPWEVGGFNASLQLQRGVSDAREAFSQQGHLVSRCHWRLKIRLPFHDPWWK